MAKNYAVITLVLAMPAMLAASTVKPQIAPPTMTCSYKSQEYGVSYDLSGAMSVGTSFKVQDRIQSNELDYLYTFGICQAVAPPKNCLTPSGASRVRWYYSPAWQTRVSEEAGSHRDADFKYLGSPEQQEHTWAVDPLDPAGGVTLTHTGGQSCSSGQRREFNIRFKCTPKNPRTVEQTVIDESAHCTYEVEIESEYACPLECGLDQIGEVCNGHGICGFDTDTKKARCYCNKGRSGQHCTEESDEDGGGQGSGAITALLVIILLGVVGVLGLLFYLFKYMTSRKASIMGDVYSSLHNPAEGSFNLDTPPHTRSVVEDTSMYSMASSTSNPRGASQL